MKEKIKIFKKEFFVVIGYILLSIYATFPVILKLNSAFYGTATDPLAWIWDFWWLKYSWHKGISSHFVSILAYPFGFEHLPLYPVWNVFNRWLSILTGEVAAYNLQIIVSFFLPAVAMYCLVYYFTKNRLASFFSGATFTLSPYHFARSWDHLCLSNMHWVIFYVLSLFILTEKRTYKSAFICGLCFGLTGHFNSYYYIYFMIIFTAAFFIFNAGYGIFRRKRMNLKDISKIVKLIGVVLIIAAIIMLPQIWRFLKMIIFSTGYAQKTGLIRSFQHLFADSARPLNYFLPTVYHPFLGKITRFFIDTPLYGENSGGEQSLYLGVVPLILTFIGYRRWKRRKKEGSSDFRQDFVMSFFVFSFFTFMIFSFSPYWGNKSGFFIPFPSYFLFRIFPMFRNYARFGVLVMASACVLAGFGLRDVMREIIGRKKKIVIYCLVTGLVLFEFLNIPPFRVTDVSKIPGVYSWLKQQPKNVVIAEYPIEADERPYLFYQRIHQKKMINGAVPATEAFEIRRKILDLTNKHTARVLSFLGVNYVLVHKDKYLAYEGGRVLGEIPDLDKQKGLVLVKSFPEVDVYEIKAKPLNPDKVKVAKNGIESLKKHKRRFVFRKSNWNWEKGDSVSYVLKYMWFIPAFNLDISVKEEKVDKNHALARLVAHLRSTGFFSNFLRIDAEYTSVFDKINLCSSRYEESYSRPENKKRNKQVIYDQRKLVMYTKDKEVKIFPGTQDPISVLFFMSSLEFKPGEKFSVYINPGKTNYKLEADIIGKKFIDHQGQMQGYWVVEADYLKLKNKVKKIASLKILFKDTEKKEIAHIRVIGKVGIIDVELKE